MIYESDNQQQTIADTDQINQIDHYKTDNTKNTIY